ncbi:MAG: hypothetical protein IJF32_13535 [Oscillospiraceae bacterium]|nr:hypothetical protein [Oscillospiraceae bacterium]
MKCFKCIILAICFLVLCCAIAIASDTSAFDTMKNFKAATYDIKLENEVISFKKPVLVEDGNTYVALRDICWALGYYADWEQRDWEVNIFPYRSKQIEVSPTTKLKDEGVIPDEETALAVGKVILEKYAEKELEYETDIMKYQLTASYLADEDAWLIIQTVKPKNPLGGGGEDINHRPQIKLDKMTGEVLYINT